MIFYDFADHQENIIKDRSGLSSPMNLQIHRLASVRR